MADLAGWKVVLADDNPDSLELVHQVLSLNGAEVHLASNGAECLKLLESLRPTLVVVDLAMPEVDGWDVLAGLRAKPATAGIPVVAMTAYHSNNVEKSAYEAGFSAYFSKPIKANSFLSVLVEVVTNNGMSQAT